MRFPTPYLRIKEAIEHFSHHRGANMAAALAFYAILSVGPLLFVILTIADTVWGREAATNLLIEQGRIYLGAEATDSLITATNESANSKKTGLSSVISICVLVFTSTLLFAQVKISLHRLWQKEKKRGPISSYLTERLHSLLFILVLGFVLLASTIAMSVLAILSNWVDQVAPWLNNQMAAIAVWFVWLSLLVSLVFKFFSGKKLSWRSLFIGAAATSAILVASKELLAWYLAKTANMASAYGAAGALGTVAMWAYFSSMALFLGASLSQVIEKNRPK